jgi:hypothetical protein
VAGWPDPTYDRMAADLQPFTDPGKYILVAATAFMDDGGNPTGNLFRTLETFGAGRLLGLWLNDPNHGVSAVRRRHARSSSRSIRA